MGINIIGTLIIQTWPTIQSVLFAQEIDLFLIIKRLGVSITGEFAIILYLETLVEFIRGSIYINSGKMVV